MAEFDVLDVVRDGVEALRLRHHLFAGHEHELGILVDELLDEPWACNAIDLDAFASNPLHSILLFEIKVVTDSTTRQDENSAMDGLNHIKLVRRSRTVLCPPVIVRTAWP